MFSLDFISDKLVSLRPKERPVYYHRKFARVPTIDECELEDEICKYEANEQLARDRSDHFSMFIFLVWWARKL